MSIFNANSAVILVLLFFIITFFLSVIEKIADWKNTIAYYTNHFKNTILYKMIPVVMIQVLIFEIAAVILLCIGLYFLVLEDTIAIAKISLEVSAIILLQFLIGQRLAKDYAGAMNITVYFILTIIGIFLLT
ncbi:DoxX family protein [Lutibacter sp. A64]|uniref:DoxX family protein n=1 Tax=Lutibacter sp. A64 TaxID=2918526 RepID=UPI001F065B89|nr:DoxX family protein [Lutibacter sp. A64]UMB53063.1 DoxX family protein [Lutibacter sp. A64]